MTERGAMKRSRKTKAPDLDVSERLGREIKGLRKAKSWTISDLSAATGLSVGFLSQVERGRSSPSVKALHAISEALGVTVSFFFSPDMAEDDALHDLVVRAARRRTLSFENGIRDELLSPNLTRAIELLRCVFPPGASSGRQTYRHHGEEAGYVAEGKLRLWIGDREVLLETGDSFAFSSEEPHRYENPGPDEAVVIWAITPPSY